MFFKRYPRSKIKRPCNRDAVSRIFQAEGTIDCSLADQHLLLVVETGGLMWPKGEVQVSDTIWRSTVDEKGTPPDGKFTLSLYWISDQVSGEIAAWLARGRLTDHYPGLTQIKDGIKLHSISLRLEP